ncbi:NAD(P)H-binding protein [Streptomyces sp. TM32]|uniref:NAD(P)H-binding protein n=1 Tax=Streptomyces sp. TM32 TaxID=1652669 RepID=UPI0020B13F45|nr:NAD(P)H-binding protein [Streptomyces sp. TM32]
MIGATGNVGRPLVAGLVARGTRPRILTRDPSSAPLATGVEAVVGDLDAPGCADEVLAGAEAAFVVTAGPQSAAHDRAIAEAVARHGVRHVVKVTSVAALPPVHDSYGAAHAAAEDAYRATGARCTFLRPAAFMSNTLQWHWSITDRSTVFQPFGDLPQAVVDPADVAEVALRVLTAPALGDRAYTLTGPEPLTPRQRARRLSDALGRPLTFVDAPPEQARRAMTDAGLPPAYVDGLLASQSDPDPARGGVPLPTVRELTGRPPRTFDGWLGAHVQLFT